MNNGIFSISIPNTSVGSSDERILYFYTDTVTATTLTLQVDQNQNMHRVQIPPGETVTSVTIRAVAFPSLTQDFCIFTLGEYDHEVNNIKEMTKYWTINILHIATECKRHHRLLRKGSELWMECLKSA